MSLLLYRLGRVAARRHWRMIGAWAALVVALAVGAGTVGGTPVDNFTIPGTETQRAIDLLEERFPDQAGSSARVVFAADEGEQLLGEGTAGAVTATLDQVREQPGVVSVTDLASPAGQAQVSEDGRIAYAVVQYGGDATDLGAEAVARLDAAADTARDAGVRTELGGEVVELTAQGEVGGTAELVGLGVAVLVLLVAFGSVVAMGLPLITALVGLGSGLMLLTLGAAVTDVSTVAPVLATMIGLGVGIDYALFIVTRHREHLHAGHTVVDAVARANATAGAAVLFAGITVVIAICGLAFVGIPFVATLGYAAALVVAVAVIAALTLLPAVLGLVGHRIDKLKVPGIKVSAGDDGHGLASRWSRQVGRRPWLALVASLAVLVMLAVPFASIRLGQTDAGNAAPESTQRQAYDLLGEGFGPGFNGPLLVVVDLGAAGPEAVGPVTEALAADEGIAFAAPVPGVNDAGDTAVVTAIPTTAPDAAATTDTVHRLRDEVIPAVEDRTGVADVAVAGSTTAFIDISDKIQNRLPVFIGAVLGLSFLLLLAVFRSILVPLKAALVNLLGIGAAYGVVVAVFQWGWGNELLGMSETVPIVSFLPMFMFAILFGLSMDYEVFLMSRIREEYLRTGENLRSVSTGIATTARVITAAAVIMVSVFGSFALGDDPIVKMMGLGLATAIFLDATLIRMVLVPATMALLGDRNWWLPGWLDRLLPRIDLEGEGGLPAPEYERPTSEPDDRELVGAPS